MALTGEQWKFIARRLLATSDKDAAEKVGLNPKTIANWKQEYPEFLQEYEASFTDGVQVAKSYTRKLLGKAAERIDEGLDATMSVGLEVVNEPGENGRKQFRPLEVVDHKSRLKAVELAFKTHGLLKDKVEWTPDLSGLSNEELMNLERVLGRIADSAR